MTDTPAPKKKRKLRPLPPKCRCGHLAAIHDVGGVCCANVSLNGHVRRCDCRCFVVVERSPFDAAVRRRQP